MNRLSAAARIAAAALALLTMSLTSVYAASVNDTARYLAGLPVAAESPLAPMTRENAWRHHASTLDAAWARIEKNQLRNIRAWSKQNIPGARKQMLYTFSGPDFLYADAFFPNAETYVLSALEPVGPVPDLARMSPGARAVALQELRGSLQTVLNYSFFITKQMKSDMRGGRIVGNLPVLLVFIARAGNTVNDVDFVALNPDGLAVPPGVGFKGSSPGVRIDFTDNKGKSRQLYYFQTDLSNGGLDRSGFRAFSRALGPADSLIKSASYLLHSGNFSHVRDFILEQSDVIVEDASGVPLRNFPKDRWEFHPFGRYAGPISIFAKHYQRDMASLFRGARPIDFGIGYRWRRHETSVLLAIKKK